MGILAGNVSITDFRTQIRRGCLRILRSLQFRTGHAFRTMTGGFFKFVVSRCSRRKLNVRSECDYRLLLFSGRKHLPMLQESLYSIYRTWTKVPRIEIVSDGSLSDGELLEAFAWWPTGLTASQWHIKADHQRALGREGIYQFAQQNIMGRKLASILTAGEHEPTLFCDSDLLWFRGPPPVPGGTQPACKTMMDVQPHFDMNLLARAGISNLEAAPPLNTGLCYVRGDLYETCQLGRVMTILAEESNYFSEQTTLAYCSRLLHAEPWPQNEIALDLNDKYWPLWPNFSRRSWFARHYVGDVRHWFWRDAYLTKRLTGPL